MSARVSTSFVTTLHSRYGGGASSAPPSDVTLGPGGGGQDLAMRSDFVVPSGLKGLKMLEEQLQRLDAEQRRQRASSSQQQVTQMPMQMPFGPEQFTHRANPAIKMAHGTTTMAFLFKTGVIIAVDSRASMGSYIGSGTVKKVIKISQFLLGTMAGGAADCSFWERRLALQTRLHELREGSRITVCAASKLLGDTVYQYRNHGLSMGTMVAGWDEATGPALYYVDNDGTRLKGDRFSVGSGSTYAYGILDNEYRYDLSVDEAVELGKRAIWHATHRDAYSGGVINVFVITGEGWKQHYAGDMNELYYGQYAHEYGHNVQVIPTRPIVPAAAAAASEDGKMQE